MKTAQRTAIVRHGEQLLAIFPEATERDPLKLCKKLRRLESDASHYTLMLCNGDYLQGSEQIIEDRLEAILGKVNKLLGNYRYDDQEKARVQKVPVRINRDPRGYALKISDRWMNENKVCLHRDWGGYGIIAPDIS